MNGGGGPVNLTRSLTGRGQRRSPKDLNGDKYCSDFSEQPTMNIISANMDGAPLSPNLLRNGPCPVEVLILLFGPLFAAILLTHSRAILYGSMASPMPQTY